MSLTDAAAPTKEDTPLTQFTTALGAALFLVALGDWLFWGQALGMSAAVWLFAVILAAMIVNWRNLDMSSGVKAALIALWAAAPLIETINALSITVAAFGLATAALIACGAHRSQWPKAIFESVELLCLGPFRLLPDFVIAHESGERILPKTNLTGWIVPIVFSLIFLLLFSSANPLIDKWVSALSVSKLWDMLSIPRIIFWVAALSVAWGFIRARVVSQAKWSTIVGVSDNSDVATPPKSVDPFATLFSPTAILRSLVMFNLLFAVQTGLDVAYLWRGVAFPDGMSYATYAHRGAYPLMITAGLAAVFVVATFGPGKSLESSPLARGLVFAWIVQNVLLVVSSIQRLNIYVDVYALSYWRIAAFIWMGLVAVGLVLILVRIASKRSNNWLIGANAAAAGLVLYACCFVNFPRVIADYNIAHSRELSGKGVALDSRYIKSLGHHAVPALMRYSGHRTHSPQTGWPEKFPTATRPRFCLVQEHLENRLSNWRAWAYRDHRLLVFLNSQKSQC